MNSEDIKGDSTSRSGEINTVPLAQRLRAACVNVFSKSMPLGDFAPLLQQAADALDTNAELLEVCRLFAAYQAAIDRDDPASRPLEAYSTAMDACYAVLAKTEGRP